MTCRAEILAAFKRLAAGQDRDTFSPAEVIAELRSQGTRYRESTIRTHIVSRLCGDAPDHHAVVYDDLERVGPAMYRLRTPRS